MIEALTRTLWGVRRAATDGVPADKRLAAAKEMTVTAATDKINRDAIEAGHAALDRLNSLHNAAIEWNFEPDDGETPADVIQSFHAEGASVLDNVLRPCASVTEQASAAIVDLIAALTAMRERR